MEQNNYQGALQQPINSGFSAKSTANDVIKGIDLNGKIAIVTGGNTGIGLETTKILAAAGAKVIVAARDIEKAKKNLKDVANVELQKIDLMDPASIDTFAAQFIASERPLHILINNAGITRDKTLLKMSHDEWQQVIDVNLTGVFNCTKAVAPYMVEKQYGRIICTSSIVGVHGNFGQTNYVAAKAGLIGMVKTWAKELAKHGITSNAVAPGFIRTEMTEAMPEEVQKAMISQIPLKRMGDPKDIAYAYLYLASEEASFVNGQVLGVNGGQAS